MKFAAMLNVRNEERWIARVIRSLYPLTTHITILDDHSTDQTADVCRSFPFVRLIPSPFEQLDKRRDKQWLLYKVMRDEPDWIVAIDGDEVLDTEAPGLIRKTASATKAAAFSLRILYLWDRGDLVRVDGVYANFRRPSVFRLSQPFTFLETPFTGNLHCPNVPQGTLHEHDHSPAKIWHFGYFDSRLRAEKYARYTNLDPDNAGEDHYRHMVQGDVPEVPADAVLKHAGPLCLKHISEIQ